jgi:hypothetical protein
MTADVPIKWGTVKQYITPWIYCMNDHVLKDGYETNSAPANIWFVSNALCTLCFSYDLVNNFFP